LASFRLCPESNLEIRDEQEVATAVFPRKERLENTKGSNQYHVK